MAKHEFALLEQAPSSNEIFNKYEPQKYDCISIDDDFLEPVMEDLKKLNCYWHTLQNPEKGLAYTGVTLIPPQSMETFIDILSSSQNLQEFFLLVEMAKQAKEKGKYIIHFGI